MFFIKDEINYIYTNLFIFIIDVYLYFSKKINNLKKVKLLSFSQF